MLAVCRSWTWHLSAFVLGWGHLISSFLPPWVWVISFDLSSALCHVVMTSDPLMSNTAESSVVLLICSREVCLCIFNLPLILCWSYFTTIMFLCLVSMMCETLWPTFYQVTSCRLQLIIQEFYRETPFWYLGACMPQWQVFHIRCKVHIIGLRSNDSMDVRRQIIFHIL